MGLLRALGIVTALSLCCGCNSLSGLSDLEKVDCVKGCGSGGAAGSGGVLPEVPAVGRKTSCVVMTDKSVWCWGASPGVAPGTVTSTPVRVTALSDIAGVSIGLDHACAIDAQGMIYCWGRNDHGQLGDGTTASHPEPAVVPNLPVMETVVSGATHSCAYTDPGKDPVELYCWGDNSTGQLGDGTTQDSSSPLKVVFGDGAKVLRVGPGAGYTCAVVDVAGAFEMRCWGKNDKGQCGLDPTAKPVVAAPTKVPGLGPVERIYPGFEHACSRSAGTKVPWCWGANDHGQVGINTTSAFEAPQAVVGVEAIDTMSPGYRSTCMSTNSTIAAFCWGANDYGQFGSQPGADQPLPTSVPYLDGGGFVLRQAEHGCRVSDGTVWCWGANDNGQLGNGKIEPFAPPGPVIIQP